MDKLKTGDLLLFNYQSHGAMGWFTKMIKWGSHSNYTHTAMVLKDPTFIHPSLKGTYVWESSWEGTPDPQDGKTKLGVQITPISELINAYKGTNGHCYYRSIECSKDHFSEENLRAVHEVVYNKPYDICPVDWVEAFLKKDLNPQKTSRFWCSALVGYIYTKCGILDSNTDWSILAPNDLSLSGESVTFCENCKLSDTEVKLL